MRSRARRSAPRRKAGSRCRSISVTSSPMPRRHIAISRPARPRALRSSSPMPEGWQWDRTLFRGSAAYYDQGRLPYAPGYARQLAQLLGQRGEGRLLDVGCGPGTVTLALAPFFSETVGVDPDPDMLVHAARNAQRLAIANARWVEARAEDLPSTLGSFRVVLFAQSFHWTDRERVA